jgi:hypothetical protein
LATSLSWDKPHTAEVRALECSEFNAADAETLLSSDPVATLYIAAILVARLDAAHGELVELKRQLETGKPRIAPASRSIVNIVTMIPPMRPYPIDHGTQSRSACAATRTLTRTMMPRLTRWKVVLFVSSKNRLPIA